MDYILLSSLTVELLYCNFKSVIRLSFLIPWRHWGFLSQIPKGKTSSLYLIISNRPEMFYLMQASILQFKWKNSIKKLPDYHVLILIDLAQSGKLLPCTAFLILTDKNLPLLLLLHIFSVSWCVDSAEAVGLTWPSYTESSAFHNHDLVLD